MYLNKFEEYAQELAFHGKRLSETQKITILLNGVKDCQYASLKTLCRSQNFNYEKTVFELHRESQELGTNDTPKHSIKTKKSSCTNSNKAKCTQDRSKVPNNYRLTPNV